jgi:hypothetical protein
MGELGLSCIAYACWRFDNDGDENTSSLYFLKKQPFGKRAGLSWCNSTCIKKDQRILSFITLFIFIRL